MGDTETTSNEEIIEVLVEIPRGSRNKYEYEPRAGDIVLDRVLYSSVHYPADYGLMLETLSPDGDELDVLVMVEEPTFPGCVVLARPIGVLNMHDEHGSDSKILAVPAVDPRFDDVRELSDLAEHWLDEIANFFSTYKRLQDVETELEGWEDRGAAWKIIQEARARFRRERVTTGKPVGGEAQ